MKNIRVVFLVMWTYTYNNYITYKCVCVCVCVCFLLHFRAREVTVVENFI